MATAASAKPRSRSRSRSRNRPPGTSSSLPMTSTTPGMPHGSTASTDGGNKQPGDGDVKPSYQRPFDSDLENETTYQRDMWYRIQKNRLDLQQLRTPGRNGFVPAKSFQEMINNRETNKATTATNSTSSATTGPCPPPTAKAPLNYVQLNRRNLQLPKGPDNRKSPRSYAEMNAMKKENELKYAHGTNKNVFGGTSTFLPLSSGCRCDYDPKHCPCRQRRQQQQQQQHEPMHSTDAGGYQFKPVAPMPYLPLLKNGGYIVLPADHPPPPGAQPVGFIPPSNLPQYPALQRPTGVDGGFTTPSGQLMQTHPPLAGTVIGDRSHFRSAYPVILDGNAARYGFDPTLMSNSTAVGLTAADARWHSSAYDMNRMPVNLQLNLKLADPSVGHPDGAIARYPFDQGTAASLLPVGHRHEHLDVQRSRLPVPDSHFLYPPDRRPLQSGEHYDPGVGIAAVSDIELEAANRLRARQLVRREGSLRHGSVISGTDDGVGAPQHWRSTLEKRTATATGAGHDSDHLWNGASSKQQWRHSHGGDELTRRMPFREWAAISRHQAVS